MRVAVLAIPSERVKIYHLFVRLVFICFFFFSSRRRHTRYWRDWSSDVCSSDLTVPLLIVYSSQSMVEPALIYYGVAVLAVLLYWLQHVIDTRALDWRPLALAGLRSEERRVGKEGRSRWSPYH